MRVIFLSLLLLSCFSCITVSVNNDNSEFVAENDPFINTLEDKSVNEIAFATVSDTIIYYEINADAIRALQKKPTIVYVWAYWCKPCVEKLPEIISYSKEENNIIFVSADYNYVATTKLLKSMDYTGVQFLLDSDKYGSKMNKKMENFRNDICIECSQDERVGFPSIYIIDEANEVIFHSFGSLSATELRSEYEQVMPRK